MEINLKEKYLPVGTVVLLKGAKKRIMITGFCVMAPEVENKLFDYCGCIYPEGYLNSNQNCLFNHDQIDKVYHVGLVDDEETKFKKQLKEVSPLFLEKLNEELAKRNGTNTSAPAASNVAPTAAPAPAPAAPATADNAPSVINFMDEKKEN